MSPASRPPSHSGAEPPPHHATGAATTRAGYVTLVGRPNAGKSTLLNALVGERLSIVSSKEQTTWQRVTGILTEEGVQMIFLDTPGLLVPGDRFQRSMLGEAHEALREADVVLTVLDPTRRLSDGDRGTLRDAHELSSAPSIVAVNKVDVAEEGAVADREAWAREGLRGTVIRVSAAEGTGLDTLKGLLRERLPESPFLYPEEDLASEPVRFFVTELVRETVFEQYRQEIPYSVVARVEEFRESQDPVYIGVTLYVERKSQKGILVGQGGSAIRSLGTAAREKIEHFLGRRVYLDLWVKVLPGWRRRDRDLRRLGFRVPDDDPPAGPGNGPDDPGAGPDGPTDGPDAPVRSPDE